MKKSRLGKDLVLIYYFLKNVFDFPAVYFDEVLPTDPRTQTSTRIQSKEQ